MSTPQDVLNVARSQLGYVEGRNNDTKYGKWYGMNNAAWCDMFVSWVAAQAGAADIIGKFAYTPSHYQWFKNKGQVGSEPRVGALVFFYFPSQGRIAHLGIVEAVRPDGTFVTIEGNTDVAGGRTGGQVMRKVRSRKNSFFAYPAYSESSAAAPSAPVASDNLKRGSRGPAVRAVQERLRLHGYNVAVDGDFGPATLAAVVAFQKSKGLAGGGVVGPTTLGLLNQAPPPVAKAPSRRPAKPVARPTLRKGDRGEHVVFMQKRLQAHGYRLTVDGIFGPGSDRSVRAFQKKKGLVVDGAVGPNTWKALG